MLACRRCLAVPLLLLAMTGLVAADPLPRGGRVLAVDVNMSASQAAASNYDAAWALAAQCGIQNVGLSLDWNQIETVPGSFIDPNGWLLATNVYYPAAGASVTLTLRPLHNSVKPVPGDLAATRFVDTPATSSTMATRFCAMLDWVITTQLPNVTFEALVVGSEYDVYLNAHPAEWSDYGYFMQFVVNHVRASAYSARIPRIAAEATFDGYHTQPAGVAAINGLCDVAGVSYYAIGAGFDTKNAAAIQADFAELLTFGSATKPLCFYQFGCPSSYKDGGGTVHDRSAQQATFIAEAFAFWDANPGTVRLMDFTWLHDLSPADLAIQGAYFGSADQSFLNFLAALGLRTYAGNGSDKAGFTALRHQARARGWGNAIPVANGGVLSTSASTAVAFTLTGSDGNGDPLTYTVITGPAHGALSGTAPALTYTPAPGYVGSDSVVFRVADADAQSPGATVAITVSASGSGGGSGAVSSSGGGSGGGGGCGGGLAAAGLIVGLSLSLRRGGRSGPDPSTPSVGG